MPKPVRNILFITWDGPETRYLERLFLPVLAGLRDRGYRPHVLQFTWGEVGLVQERAALCEGAGVPYRAQRIWRAGGAAGPFLSALFGARAIRRVVAEWGIDTLMPRSLMPALAVMRMPRQERAGLTVVFDADGLPADERVDFAGLSPLGLTYRLLRDIEMRMLLQADAVLTRTEAARSVLLARAGGGLRAERCHLVTNGVDPVPFAAAFAAAGPRGTEDLVLCYCGSIGAQYRLPEMLDVALRIRSRLPQMRLKLISPHERAIRDELARRGLAEASWIETCAAHPDQVPVELASCDLGLALREPAFSTRAVQPIKIGEYLLAGMPVLGTPGVGDTETLTQEGVFQSVEVDDLDAAIDWIATRFLPMRDAFRLSAHRVGLRDYAVAGAVSRYESALSTIDRRVP